MNTPRPDAPLPSRHAHRRHILAALALVAAIILAPLAYSLLHEPTVEERVGALLAEACEPGKPNWFEQAVQWLTRVRDSRRRGEDYRTLCRLTRLGPAAAPALAAALRDDDTPAKERGVALAVLSVIDRDAAVEAMVAVASAVPLASADREVARNSGRVREQCIDGLGNSRDPRAVEPLVAALADADDCVRMAAARALGDLGDARSVDPLIATLTDAHWALCVAAAEALGEMGDTRAVPALIARVSDANPLVRKAAVTALGNLRDPRAVEALIVALEDVEGDTQIADAASDVREAAAEALGDLADLRAVETLMAALDDPDEDVRLAVAEALGCLGDPGAVEPLIAALADADEGVRARACEALGLLGDARAVQPLLAILATAGDDEAGTVGAAVRALGELGDGRAVEPILGVLRGRSRAPHAAAAHALGLLADPRAADALAAATEDEDVWVRGEAARALGAIGRPQDVPVLVRRLEDEEPIVAASAMFALGLMGRPEGVRHASAMARFLWESPQSEWAAVSLALVAAPEARAALEEVSRLAMGGDIRRMAAACLVRPVSEVLAGDRDADDCVYGWQPWAALDLLAYVGPVDRKADMAAVLRTLNTRDLLRTPMAAYERGPLRLTARRIRRLRPVEGDVSEPLSVRERRFCAVSEPRP
jgi:HEAT repeat protein